MLGLTATVVLGILALVQTIRANGLQVSSAKQKLLEQRRDERFRLFQAMEEFVDERMQSMAFDHGLRMQDVALAIGLEPEGVETEWVIREGDYLFQIARRMPRDENGKPTEPRTWRDTIARRRLIRLRLLKWVQTGEFDDSKLPEVPVHPPYPQ
ncbi:hypothetical protein [Microbacterium resistens]|uniref:hypothetical protein n=1 Tax=Microbacterium resistens TaxID=156977 RepID=UPI0036732388